MPTHGGTSDKFGNRYEFLWAVDQLLRILEGKALDFTLEPISPEESKGIEFKVTNADGTVDYWSVKRQKLSFPYAEGSRGAARVLL